MLAFSPIDLSSTCAHDEHEYTGNQSMLEDFSFDDLFLDFDDNDVMPGLEVEPAELDLGDFLFDGDEKCLRTAAGDFTVESSTGNSPSPEAEHNHRECTKPSASKGNEKKSHKKKKGKVDWTPELHRRFVQAVELLGIDKAVPSRILEIMGTDGLTRHNIASHLQKYRSHRRHLLAREAAAASWSQRRQTHARAAKREAMLLPTMGFPPRPPLMPLHVWGHPPPPPPPPPHWIPPPQAWPSHYPLACYPRPVPRAAVRFPTQHPLYGHAERGSAARQPNKRKKICSRQQLQLLSALPVLELVFGSEQSCLEPRAELDRTRRDA